MRNSINICRDAANMSTDYEINNSYLKKSYLLYNIMLYNRIVNTINGKCGSFGTGYPFYALGPGLTGQLPVIDEQIRYNNELIEAVEKSNYETWTCADCLSKNSSTMPDLKQICKPCPNMSPELKPRKIINRLPDIDLWMVCEKGSIEEAQDILITLFEENNMCPSDINPLKTIDDLAQIIGDIKKGIMPSKLLPIDAHIIDYDTLYSLISQVPDVLKQSSIDGKVPYLPILPLSYRKVWQYDDEAYNFVHDYLSSFTDFNFKADLRKELIETRRIIANSYSFDQLYGFLLESGPKSVKNRHKTKELKYRFKERIDSWKK